MAITDFKVLMESEELQVERAHDIENVYVYVSNTHNVDGVAEWLRNKDLSAAAIYTSPGMPVEELMEMAVEEGFY